MTSLFNHGALGGRIARATALCLLALAAVLCHSPEARAQWVTSGTNTTTTNNVGVGTAAPVSSIHVTTSTTAFPRGITNEQTSVDNNAAMYVFRKSRAGAVVQTGDNIGNLIAEAFDGAAFISPARLRFAVDGAVTVGSIPTALQFFTGTGGGGGLERMRITSSGAIGVATTTPLAPLHVSTGGPSGGVAFFQKDAASNGVGIGTTNGVAAISGVNSNYTLTTDLLINPYGGRVGIGTTTPTTARLVISGAAGFTGLDLASTDQYAEMRVIRNSLNPGDKDLYLQWQAGVGSKTHFYSDNAETMTINAGNVGVGTTTPVSKLHVAGNITVDGNINAKYQDVAEWVPSRQKLNAGTVVILDVERDNHVAASATAYDTRVAGVISAQPGISLGERGEGKVLVATTGRVKVRVDATRGAIKVGDLLVTSDRTGYAMKSEAVMVGKRPMHSPGTIIGKALESLASGTGEILVLLSLQ